MGLFDGGNSGDSWWEKQGKAAVGTPLAAGNPVNVVKTVEGGVPAVKAKVTDTVNNAAGGAVPFVQAAVQGKRNNAIGQAGEDFATLGGTAAYRGLTGRDPGQVIATGVDKAGETASKWWDQNITNPATAAAHKIAGAFNKMTNPGGAGMGGTGPGGAPMNGDFGINNPAMTAGAGPQSVNVTGAGTNAQNQALAYMQAQANGTAPSVVGQQYKNAQQAQQAALLSQAASQRGGPNALGARTAMQQNAQQGAALAQQAGVARMQEQQAAQQGLGNLATGARNTDVGLATSNANLGQQYQQLQAQYAQMGLSAEQARAQASMDVQKLALEQQKASNAAKAGIFGAAGTLVGGLVNMFTGQPTTSNDPNATQAQDQSTNVANTIDTTGGG